MNPAFFGPRLSIVPQFHKNYFARIVSKASQKTAMNMSGPSSPLKCDEEIDRIIDRYPSIDDAGPAATPVCFDDPVGDYICPGTREYDPLAGVDAILDGY